MLKFYNSLGRKLEEFKPLKEGEVRMYTCGPTVWNYATIGNFRTFVFEDVLRKYLKFKGFKVTQVMNITDVEDKIIRGIRETGKPLKELTAFYEAAFKQDLTTLGVEPAEVYPRATEHLKEMLRLIRSLKEKGYAYDAPDGSVYFDVSKFKPYGSLSGVKLDSLRPAGRVSSDHYEEKLEAADFALWKAWDPEDGEVYWETELGKGRPGWHIECSAMSMKYLGESFDIHTGGLDNKFPHHENEIAQSEAATGRRFVNYWLHSEFLTIDGEAMHKSVGNVVYLGDLVKRGWDPLTIRLLLISARYRDQVDLNDRALGQSRSQRARLQDLVSRLRAAKGERKGPSGLGEALLKEFEESMDDDLNTPRALAALFSFAKKANSGLDGEEVGGSAAGEALEALAKVNAVLGVLDLGPEELDPGVAKLLELREAARNRRDFQESDRLRDELLARGIVVEDTPEGTVWKRRPRG